MVLTFLIGETAGNDSMHADSVAVGISQSQGQGLYHWNAFWLGVEIELYLPRRGSPI